MAATANEALFSLLQQCSLAQGLSAGEVQELLASAQVRQCEYSKGEIIFHEGDMPKSLYILLAGEVHILKDTFSGGVFSCRKSMSREICSVRFTRS